ncbi:hypothetical protein HYH03_000423 [Edaphochlamys debaryana]|uniref:Centromere protein J C-terminal domain-containing protein n=1 Tax=Edaphochlamys debaryana TaxID=47281 RepID=A0A836C6H7_9CHLO|nr:hypothetical protein HYH03_000423 [Edaphochlamys debaryana]|eukprot:KAG2501925.1 hypothetical protein HYH03_000423 [Edaphochlamys debaryana]
MEEPAAASSSGGPRAPKPFLRRGEGVEKRVFSSRYRKPSQPGSSSGNNSAGGAEDGLASAGASSVDVGSRRGDQLGRRGKASSAEDTGRDDSPWGRKGQELTADTHLLSVERKPDQRQASGASGGNRFLRNSIQNAWATQQAEEELELEEFRALETQIKADVVGASRHRSEAVPQAQASSSSSLPPPAPNGRSYASIHQRPPQPPLPPRPASRASDRSAASERGGFGDSSGWSPPQQPASRPTNGFGATDDGEDVGTDGFGSGFGGGYGDVDANDDGDTWGTFRDFGPGPGKPGPHSGGSGDGAGDFGQGLDSARELPATSGFGDADAWNDTSSFFGGATARRGTAAGPAGRQVPGAGASATGGFGAGGRSAAAPPPQPLDDPWAAPADAGGFDDDAWGAGRQQQQQAPQHHGASGPARPEPQGPDQPFVRALFGKQQQQGQRPAQSGGARPGPGKGKAAEPVGPSPAEVERMRMLEEQATAVATERAALVRMRTELEKAANRLEQERQAWERSKTEEQARWEAQREAEEARLRRDRRVLEKQSKALLKLPNKKERTAMEAAEAALEAERRERRAAEARHKLTVERLRRQLLELQERNHELREEVRWHEAQQLERGWGGPAPGASRPGAGGAPAAGAASAGARSRASATPGEPGADASPYGADAPGGPGHGSATARGRTPGPAGASAAGAASRGPAAGPPGARPRSSGSGLTGPQPSAPGRLRPLGSARPDRAPGPSAGTSAAPDPSQSRQPAAWRAQREGARTGPGFAGHGPYAGDRGDPQYGYDGEEDELGPEGEGEYGGFEGEEQSGSASFYGTGRRPAGWQAQQEASSSAPWWDQREGAGEEDFGEGAELEEEDGYGGEESGFSGFVGPGTAAQAGGAAGAGPAGRSAATAPRRGPAGAGAAGGASAASSGRGGFGGFRAPNGGATSSPATSYTQRDDAEVLTDEGCTGGTEGEGEAEALDEGSAAELAWQQHQAFMARVGLGGRGQRGLATQPVHGQAPAQGSGRPGNPQAAAARSQPAQGQQAAQGPAGSRPRAPGAPGPAPGPGPKGPAGGQQPGSAFFSGAAPASSAQSRADPQQPGPRPAVGPRPAGPGPAPPGPPAAAAPTPEDALPAEPSFDLGGVSQTLAALRLDRNAAAATAAASASGAYGAGQHHGQHQQPGWAQQVPQQQQQQQHHQPTGGWQGPPGPGDAWRTGAQGDMAGSMGPGAAQRTAALGTAGPRWQGRVLGQPGGSRWPGAEQTGPAQMSQQPAYGNSGQPQRGGMGPGMVAAAAGAAAVASAVAAQQLGPGGGGRQPGGPHGAAGPGASAGGGEVVVREVRHADGKLERTYSSGRRLVLFANGTRKVSLPDGSSRVYFANGDIKWTIPASAASAPTGGSPSDGSGPTPPGIAVVHYYYAEVSTWHSTYGGEGGMEVFYFPAGQTEAHHPGGAKEILFPDDVLRVVTPEGDEVDVGWQQLSWAVRQPVPQPPRDEAADVEQPNGIHDVGGKPQRYRHGQVAFGDLTNRPIYAGALESILLAQYPAPAQTPSGFAEPSTPRFAHLVPALRNAQARDQVVSCIGHTLEGYLSSVLPSGAPSSLVPPPLSKACPGWSVEVQRLDGTPFTACAHGASASAPSAAASAQEASFAWRRSTTSPCNLVGRELSNSSNSDGSSSDPSKVKLFRKVTTRRVVQPGGWQAAAEDGGRAVAERAMSELCGEVVAFVRKQADLFRHYGSQAAAEALSAPFLAWKVLPSPGPAEDGCVDLVLYARWAERGDLSQALMDIAGGSGLDGTCAASASAASEPGLDGPPVAWRAGVRVLADYARTLDATGAAGIVNCDAKPSNAVADEDGHVSEVDPDGNVGPSTPASELGAADGGAFPADASLPAELRPVPVGTYTDQFKAPEMVFAEAFDAKTGEAAGDAEACDRIMEAPQQEPALAALVEAMTGREVPAAAGSAPGGSGRRALTAEALEALQELAGLGGGRSFACVKSHTWLYGASVAWLLKAMRAELAARAGRGGWAGLGGANGAWLGRLEALCGACRVLQPSRRPSLAWVAAELEAMCA